MDFDKLAHKSKIQPIFNYINSHPAKLLGGDILLEPLEDLLLVEWVKEGEKDRVNYYLFIN